MGKHRVRHDWVTNTFSFYPFWKSQLLSPENPNEHTHMPTLCTWLQSSQCSEVSCQTRELQLELVRTRTCGRGMRQRMGCEGYRLANMHWRPQKRHCPKDHSTPAEPWVPRQAPGGAACGCHGFNSKQMPPTLLVTGIAIQLSIKLPLTQWLQKNPYLSKFIESSVLFLYVVFFQPHNSIWIVHPFERPLRGLKILQ